MQKINAPIVLFVYNRPWHTEQTVTALLKNDLAAASDLIVYSDAPKNDAAAQKVEGVRSFIKGIHGFKSVSIIEREKNWGLADNIIDGVTFVIKKHGKAIVLEDDIVTSPFFLRYMNEALDFYDKEEKVWHINGYMFPVDTTKLSDTFFTKGMFCWGWGTWKRAWQHYKRDPEKLPSQFSKEMIRDFNYDGTNNFFGQILANKDSKLHTWAIFWYATIFLNNGLCLCSKNSLTQNIGQDGSGMHSGKTNSFEVPLRDNPSFIFNTSIKESIVARELLIHFFKSLKRNILMRLKGKLFAMKKKYMKMVNKM
jgi:hypothetical protein